MKKTHIRLPIKCPFEPMVDITIDQNNCRVTFAKNRKHANLEAWETVDLPDWLSELIFDKVSRFAVEEHKEKLRELLE
jgi:hypothetical protein